MHLNLRNTRLLFDAGGLSSAEIVPALFGEDGWNLQLKTSSKTSERVAPSIYNLKRNRPPSKDALYKSIDAAFRAAYSIGFRDVRIVDFGSMLQKRMNKKYFDKRLSDKASVCN